MWKKSTFLEMSKQATDVHVLRDLPGRSGQSLQVDLAAQVQSNEIFDVHDTNDVVQ